MSVVTEVATSGRDHYARLYESDLAREAEWLRRGAVEKVNSIEQLLAREGLAPSHLPYVVPKVLMELGCGTGAVIQECQRRRLAREYVAIDWSEEALGHLRSTARAIELVRADVTTADFSARGRVDVVVLSHLLEHLEEPRAFLRSVVEKLDFGHLVVEVPLEDLAVVRWRHSRAEQLRNRAGHVQFFTGASFQALLREAGLEVVATRRYVPRLSRDDVRFLAAKNGLTAWQEWRCLLTNCVLPRLCGPLWSVLKHAHFAALCRKASPKRW